MSEGGWDDGNLYMHERGVFGVLAFDSFKAVTFHGWVADLDKSGKLIVPVGLFRKWVMVWHGIVLVWVSNCTFARAAPSGQAGRLRPPNRETSTTFTSLTLSSTFQSPPI